MNEQYIIQNAIHNLLKDKIRAKCREAINDDFIDGKLTLHLKNHPAVVLNVDWFRITGRLRFLRDFGNMTQKTKTQFIRFWHMLI